MIDVFTEYVTEDDMSDTKRIHAFLEVIIVKKIDDISCYNNDMQHLMYRSYNIRHARNRDCIGSVGNYVHRFWILCIFDNNIDIDHVYT
jgi:hypothetical protein